MYSLNITGGVCDAGSEQPGAAAATTDTHDTKEADQAANRPATRGRKRSKPDDADTAAPEPSVATDANEKDKVAAEPQKDTAGAATAAAAEEGARTSRSKRNKTPTGPTMCQSQMSPILQ